MSLAEVQVRHGTEETCRRALIRMRWPEGCVCPDCGSPRHCWSPARCHCPCADCRLRTSAKAAVETGLA